MIYLFISILLVIILTLFRPYLLEGLSLSILCAGVTLMTTNIFVQVGFAIVGIIGMLIVIKSTINTINGYLEIG